jgi:hypothetical protein
VILFIEIACILPDQGYIYCMKTYLNKFHGRALSDFQEMLANFPFDSQNHYLIAIEYDGCEYTDFVGVAANMTQAKRVLKIAYKRIKGAGPKYQPALLQNGRHVSFCI